MKHPRATLAVAALQSRLAAVDAMLFGGTAAWHALKGELALTARLAAHVLAREHGRLRTYHAIAVARALALVDGDDLMGARHHLLAALQETRS
ncbi:MAG: hypothetical protein SFW09_20860 [Hyphomicrobiaceae bacterium]|nr:hypothetical protein [Hyphomicrobiaceae bacterium]